MASDNRPKVGLGVCVVKDGQVLLGQRLHTTHGQGSWCFPGGHLEFGESWEDCARREVAEESGLQIGQPTFIVCTNDIFPEENKHYITIYMQAAWQAGEPKVLEPDKMVKWDWFDWEELPTPLFIPMQNLLKSGYRPH